jgi:autotransporter-associated beta strand protein
MPSCLSRAAVVPSFPKPWAGFAIGSLSRLRRKLLPFLCLTLAAGHAVCAEVDLVPTTPPPGDGEFTQTTVAGEPVWQNTGGDSFIYFKRPTSFAFTAGQTLYLRVTYFDDTGGGRLDMRYDSQTAAFTDPVVHTRTSRVGSGQFVDGFFELTNVRFTGRVNGSDLRLIAGAPGGVPFSIRRVTLSDVPFPNPDFQLAITRPWQSRYTGPAKDYVDPTTLKGKVMAGYQGWFRTPNDIEDGGWRHWISGQTMAPENFTIDMWPDLTEYDPATLFRAADIMTAGGAPAHIFSSASYPAVLKHFRWMRKHNIDGAWLQRFRMHAGSEADFVLRNISQAAAEEGRIWGVEYDVSGKSDSAVLGLLQADWQWLTSQFDILNDPRYVREDGKPVVFIWGLPVPDRNFTPATADAVVDWFQAQGCHVIGGIPNVWAGLSAAWQTHIAKYDGVLVWQSSNTSEVATFNNRGQDYYPHIWPGFSWAHLKKLPASPPTQYTDRNGGQFYWDKGRTWINAGADRLFIGMFDEYDEGTAIMPMTDDPPPPYTEWGRFINNQGKPSDWWMMLSDELKRMMWGQRTNSGTLPTVESLANRSNIGPEASIDLGATDTNNSLTRVNNADGNTIVETVGGLECRGNASPTSTHRYMYFNVNNAFAFQLANGDVTIEVEYFDSFYGSGAGTVLGLQYDSASAAFTTHPQSITTTNSGTWRTVRFEIADAFFGGRQNGSSDFRLNFNGRKLNVNRVWVRLPEPKAYPFTWTNATAGPALNWSQNANWLGGIVAQPDPTSVVRFFPDQTMPGGTIPISNNVSGQTYNQLRFGGSASSSADTTVTLSGNALILDGTAPEIALQATKDAFGLSYDIATSLTLPATTQFGGDGDATFLISGAIGGSGGLTKTGISALALAGASTFTGGVSLQTGALHLNSNGAAGTNGPLGNGGTFTINGGTIDNTSGSAKVLANINPIVVGGNFNFSSANGTGANNLTLPGGMDLGGTARTITTNGAGVLTLSGVIDNGALVKSGTGQLTLTGANTFTGGVTLQAGALNLNSVGVAGTSGPLGNGGTFTINGGTIDNTSGSSKVVANVNPIVVGGDFNFSNESGTSANNLTLPGTINLGGTARTITTQGAAVLTLPGIISNGALVKTGTGQMVLQGNNTFGGGFTIRTGTVESRTTQTTLGSGTVTMGGSGSNGAVFQTGQSNSNPFIINAPDSGTVTIGSNGAGSGFTLGGPITLNGNLTFQTFSNSASPTTPVSSASISGGITGTGNLLLNNFGSRANFINISTTAVNHNGSITLQGAGTGNTTISANIGPNVTGITQNSTSSVLVLSGANNTFAGDTTVNAGTLRITQAANPDNANSGNDASTVTLAASGATLNLTYAGTDRVDKLFIGTTQMAAGVYGTSATAIPQITGSGTLTVITGPPFAVWIAGEFANGQVAIDQRGPNHDFDNDGIRNLIEYAIASQDPTVPNPTVGSFNGVTLSFAKRQGTTGLSYAIQESTDLGVNDVWDEVEGDDYVNDPNTISYPLTPGTPPTNFLRLKVIEGAPSAAPLPP